MAKEQENTMNYAIQDDRVIGEVQIADEVVAIIAGLAATEVKGVASMYGNITNELVAKLGMKNLSKGVKLRLPAAKSVWNWQLIWNMATVFRKSQGLFRTR